MVDLSEGVVEQWHNLHHGRSEECDTTIHMVACNLPVVVRMLGTSHLAIKYAENHLPWQQTGYVSATCRRAQNTNSCGKPHFHMWTDKMTPFTTTFFFLLLLLFFIHLIIILIFVLPLLLWDPICYSWVSHASHEEAFALVSFLTLGQPQV